MSDEYLDFIMNKEVQVDNPHLLKKRKELEYSFDKDTIIRLLEAVAKSPPTVTDNKHPTHWWNTQFGKRIRQDWSNKIETIIEQVKRMVEPW